MKELDDWIAARDMTQKAFGELIGVSQATVSDYLRGEMEPTMRTLRRIRKVTGIPFDKLIGNKPKSKQGNSGGSEPRAAPG
jgi:transcriptional regulator with XRE-family HTH domain